MELMKVCQGLLDLGHTICLWLPDHDSPFDWPDVLDRYGIQDSFPIRRVRSAQILRGYDFSLKAVLAARSWGCDLVYVWPYQAAALASQIGLPTVLELHDEPPAPHGLRLFRAFLSGRGALRILPTTRALHDRMEQLAGRSFPDQFSVLSPNGVDLEKYSDLPDPAEARRQLGWQEHFTVGYTGHLYAGRGLGLLLELARRSPETRFVWAGGEPGAVSAWQERLDAEGLANTLLLGFVPNAGLPLVQAACDVLVMPYEKKVSVSSGGDTARFASPMKAFEYLAAGRVILSSDLPVVREVLNSDNALLLPPEDPDAWHAALVNLQGNPALRLALAKQAQQDAQQYSWKERQRKALAELENRSQHGR